MSLFFYNMKKELGLLLKGIAMGAANVIPGVSGGTIAFVTGIYDELITSLKSFNGTAVKLLVNLKLKELAEHIHLKFLLILFTGVGLSLISLGKGLKFLFAEYPVPVWGLFFGLILASVIQVGQTINKWSPSTIISTLVGTAIAISLAFVKPAAQNDASWYLLMCGVVAISSMLLPGLSGSFVLILLGNYQLIMLEAIPDRNLKVIALVGLGAIVGFLLLSHGISYLLQKFKDQTIGALTGFIFGSLLIIWPWKKEIYLTDLQGELLLKKGQKIVMGYEWLSPELNSTGIASIGLIIIGFALTLFIDRLGKKL